MASYSMRSTYIDDVRYTSLVFESSDNLLNYMRFMSENNFPFKFEGDNNILVNDSIVKGWQSAHMDYMSAHRDNGKS